jgi:spore maturation protein CgeB
VVDALDSLDAAAATEIGARARERVLAEHTYAHRAREVEEVLRVGVAR